MKYVSAYSDRLEKAHKRIKELESERSKLLNENAALRAIKTATISSPTAKPRTKPTVSNDNKHYTQPTVSSRGKGKSVPLQKLDTNDEKAHRAVLINGRRHIYAAGVPTPVITIDAWTQRPSYMNGTSASCKRRSEIYEESMERRNRVDLRRLKPPAKPKSIDSNYCWNVPVEETKPESLRSDYSWGTTLVDEDKLCSEESQLESSASSILSQTALSTADTEVSNPVEQCLAQRSRLDDNLDLGNEIVYIDPTSGLRSLREAFEMTQQAILDVKSCMPEWHSWIFEDNRNLVRLGRDEMIRWMGSFEYSRRFHNGYPCRDIYHALLRLPPLRNTICHPRGCELRDPENLDYLLRDAQRVSVMLGDEKRAQSIRVIRDALRTEVEMCMQEIKDVHDLAALPFYEAEHKAHHSIMFKMILDERYTGCQKALTVAQAWQCGAS
ncbi:hypothetical protein FHL15_005319 [Xylaria flabelliformis]|uniref:Uncharacterized protein n=1 Tax=Xylaria flabelliformis TaxID=2512241 RepID=A0A553I0B5_9PEZI|nr:hypothetical protein FHL15_005319 [Xylaria flabelliformis]